MIQQEHSTTNAGRLEYIDWMKALGIFIVVLGHQPLTSALTHDWIFSFHMPLFFFISGFLCKPVSNQGRYLVRNVRQLVLVIVPYYLVGMAFNLMQSYAFYRADFSVQRIVLGGFARLLRGESTMGAMWFLLALFWMRIVYGWVAPRLGRWSCPAMLLMSVAVACVVWWSGFRWNYYQLTAFLLAFPFYCCGAWMRSADVVGRLRLRRRAWLYALGFLALSFALLPLTGSINLNDLCVGQGFPLYYLAGMVGILFFLALAQRLPRLRVVETISEGTLVILGLHMMLIQVFKLVYKKLLLINYPPPYMDLLSGVLISLFILVLLYFPVRWILRSRRAWVRFLAGKR